MHTIQITDDGKLKTSELLAKLKERFDVWSLYADAELDAQFPAPKTPITRHFLDSQEPDAETLGKSAQEVGDFERCITLRERMLLELAYFDKHGEHLDEKGWTICSGSRYSGGGVPGMYWSPDSRKVSVGSYGIGCSNPGGGIRKAVSLDPQSSDPSLSQRVSELEAWREKVDKVLKV